MAKVAWLLLCCVYGSGASRASITRRVNWWFNALNTSFGQREAEIALAHRGSITGVYQWIQPNGYNIRPDGSVAVPPESAIRAATEPLLTAGLESGLCVPTLNGALLSGNAPKAVPTLLEHAERYNFSTIILDIEPYPGVNGTEYCSNATAHLYADLLRALADGMHASGRRAGMCIEMGCLLGPAYWPLYASTGVDVMMSMGSTYYGRDVASDRAWLDRELAALNPSRVAVGIGSVSRGTPQSDPACWPPALPDPKPTMYGWNDTALAAFVDAAAARGITDVDLYRHDMAVADGADCVPDFYYATLERFLQPAGR